MGTILGTILLKWKLFSQLWHCFSCQESINNQLDSIKSFFLRSDQLPLAVLQCMYL